MREIRRSAIVPYPAEAMFELIADVPSYSEFVPGCHESCIESVDSTDGSNDDARGGEVIASLGLTLAGQKGRFTTRNRMDPPRHIHLSLVEGPFSELEGDWIVEPLGDDGCRLELSMRFAFSNRMKDMLLGPVFELTCNHLVDAFVKRAEKLYG